MTDHQKEALDKAQSILREHFETSVIIVHTILEEHGKEKNDLTEITWHGGFAMAVGIVEIGKTRLLEKKPVPSESDEFAE